MNDNTSKVLNMYLSFLLVTWDRLFFFSMHFSSSTNINKKNLILTHSRSECVRRVQSVFRPDSWFKSVQGCKFNHKRMR